ncbi:carbohydrate esterase family 4 protein [Amniculicola lignicola CBS 123094]|uniref:Carbohydrate esterase family 4 protein n=1 Tax=Amniculicola lignicola CBS 123094 TaxID=1392246 RepID=A0A6A5WNM1_9PLEO|nr:carbohydrate esterase family 4 protein [Amniculicola lignicola CBS 123094]
MRFSEIFAASSVATLVAAHGLPGAPKVFGAPEIFGKHNSRTIPRRNLHRGSHGAHLSARQGGVDGRCGAVANGASCAAGYCCSGQGWCGQTEDHCEAPDCQFEFGPACDANTWPNGTWLGNEARPQLNANISYGGEGIFECVNPGDVAITYDDGPYIYTSGVIDLFEAYKMKATFFITGVNIAKGSIDDPSTPWPAMISRMLANGHQIASHTWSHQDLSAISHNARLDQMVKNEMAFRNIFGKWPTYMRPPYSSCSARSGCQADMKALGYVVSYFDLDTDDYNNVTPDLIQNAKNRFANAINPSNSTKDRFLAIAHDIHQQTAQNLTVYMLDRLVAKGYRGVTMGECLGDPKANWYRTGNGGPRPSTAVPVSTPTSTSTSTRTSTSTGPSVTPTGPPTTDGTCGSANGGTNCIGFKLGECCSQHGWCGSTTNHCNAECQPLFGNCKGGAGATTSAPTATPSVGVPTSDGTCGPANNGKTCTGWKSGECCSQFGWCGSTTDHCNAACQPLFGKCSGSSSVSSASAVSSAVVSGSPSAASTPVTSKVTSPATSSASATPSNVSKDGSCGAGNMQTCIGYGSQQCCRFDGKCGSNLLACGLGCQEKFGKCMF